MAQQMPPYHQDCNLLDHQSLCVPFPSGSGLRQEHRVGKPQPSLHGGYSWEDWDPLRPGGTRMSLGPHRSKSSFSVFPLPSSQPFKASTHLSMPTASEGPLPRTSAHVRTCAHSALMPVRARRKPLCQCTFLPPPPPQDPSWRWAPPSPLSLCFPINMYVLYVHLCYCTELWPLLFLFLEC